MDNESKINLLDYLSVVVKWRWLIFLGTLLSIMIGVIVTFIVPIYYTASVSFVPRGAIEERNELENLTGITGKQWRNIRNVSEIVEYYSAAIKSQTILQEILMTEFKSEKRKNKAQLIDILKIKSDDKNERMWNAIKKMRKVIKIGSGGGRIIALSFTSLEPQLSADVANAVLEKFGEWSKKVQQSEETLKLIEKRLNLAKDNLGKKEIELADMKKKILDIATAEAEMKIASLEREARLLENLVETLSSEYAKAEIRYVQKSTEDTIEFDIIEQAMPPYEKSNISRKIMALISLGFGLFLTLILAFFIEFFQKSSLIYQAYPVWGLLKTAKKDFIIMCVVSLIGIAGILIYYFMRP